MARDRVIREIQPVILAGGRGSRLWPLSRAALPKQLLPLVGEKIMLHRTLERIARLPGIGRPVVVVCPEHRRITKRYLKERGLFDSVDMLLEPLGRSTAPAICGAVEYVMRRNDTDSLILVLPSDHLIDHEDRFAAGIRQGIALAEAGDIVTFGIKPERPETGFGYIEKGDGFDIRSFKEKPCLEKARAYLEKGNYYWNSGMFLFLGDAFLQEMQRFCPEISAVMAAAVEAGAVKEGIFWFDADSMRGVEDISVDYALMEKTDRAKVVPVDIGWRDIGSWAHLWAERAKDPNRNVLLGDVLAVDSHDSLVYAGKKVVAAIGLQNHVIVESGDALLVSSMAASQKVKQVVSRLRAGGRDEWLRRLFSPRPWGWAVILDRREHSLVRKMTLFPGRRQCLRKRRCRNIHWVVVSGTAAVYCEDEKFLLVENQSCSIAAQCPHFLENPGKVTLEVIEVQSGGNCLEEDIVFLHE